MLWSGIREPHYRLKGLQRIVRECTMRKIEPHQPGFRLSISASTSRISARSARNSLNESPRSTPVRNFAATINFRFVNLSADSSPSVTAICMITGEVQATPVVLFEKPMPRLAGEYLS